MNKSIFYKSLAGLAVGYCLLLLLAGPLVIKPFLIKQSQNHIHGSLQLESLWINPLTNAISLKNISFHNNEGQILATAERIYINIDLLPLIMMQARIKAFQIEQLRLLNAQEGSDAWLNLTQFSITQLDAALLNKTVAVEEVLLDTLSLKPVLYKNKQNNVELFLTDMQQVLKDTIDKEASAKKQSDAGNKDSDVQESENLSDENPDISSNETKQDWLLSVQRIQVSNSAILFQDDRLASEKTDAQTHQIISNINIDIKSIYSDFSEDILLSLSMQAMNGQLEIKGQINPATLAGQLNYNLKEIQLEQLNAYVEHYSLASLESGLLNSSGAISTLETASSQKQEASQTPENLVIKLSNKTNIENLVIGHQQFEAPLLSCQLFDSGTLNLAVDANSELKQFILDTLLIDQCQINIVLLEDGSNNLTLTQTASQSNTELNNVTDVSAKESEHDAQKSEQKPLPMSIGEIKLHQHNVHIKDMTQGEAVNINISELNILINDLSEGSVDQSKIDLTAKVNGHSPLSLEGTGNFINPQISANTKLQLTRLGLSPFSPYTLTLGSRPIEKGVLSLTIDTHILENKLKSNNKASIEGIKMGKREDYKNGGNLPLALAITVLRDKNGKLNLDIPIQGNLDDPHFSIRKQLIRTLTGMINKAATAPLNMVGGLISSDNTQARIIIFKQQDSKLDDTAVKQANKIAGLLLKKPELELSLTAVLSENEAQNLSEQQQSDLLSARIKSFEKVLINSGLAADQIDKTPLDINNVKQQGGLEISFFAR